VLRWLRNARMRNAGAHKEARFGALLRYARDGLVTDDLFENIVNDPSRWHEVIVIGYSIVPPDADGGEDVRCAHVFSRVRYMGAARGGGWAGRRWRADHSRRALSPFLSRRKFFLSGRRCTCC